MPHTRVTTIGGPPPAPDLRDSAAVTQASLADLAVALARHAFADSATTTTLRTVVVELTDSRSAPGADAVERRLAEAWQVLEHARWICPEPLSPDSCFLTARGRYCLKGAALDELKLALPGL